MEHPNSQATPIAWLVEFEQTAMPGSWMDGSGAYSVVSHLTYEKPTGAYLGCATPLFDKALVALVSHALGGTSGEDAFFAASTPEELLQSELVHQLVRASCAEKRYHWLRDQQWVRAEVEYRLALTGLDTAAYHKQSDAAIDDKLNANAFDFDAALKRCQALDTTAVTPEFMKAADKDRIVWIRDDYLAMRGISSEPHKVFLDHVASIKQDLRKSGYSFSA